MQTPPFLTKLYQLVEDPATVELVSWTDAHGLSFTVHKPSDFGRDILPKYFKHNNFSSFVRQLNQYGFHKQNPDNWMFGHDSFRKDRPDLLRNITRRRPKQAAHAMSHAVVPPHALAAPNRAVVELGNYGLEGEVQGLKRDKDLLFKELVATRQAEESLKSKVDTLENRMENLEHTNKQMQAFIMHYFSQVLQPYSQAVASRKRKRLPASTSSEDVMQLVPEKDHPASGAVDAIAQVAQANPHTIDSLRVMMQQMGVNMSRGTAAPRPRAAAQPLAIEDGVDSQSDSNSGSAAAASAAGEPNAAFAPATVQELSEQSGEEVVDHGHDVRVQSPPSEPMVVAESPGADSAGANGPSVSFSFLDDLPSTPNSGLTMDAIEHALKEPSGQGDTLHIDATALSHGGGAANTVAVRGNHAPVNVNVNRFGAAAGAAAAAAAAAATAAAAAAPNGPARLDAPDVDMTVAAPDTQSQSQADGALGPKEECCEKNGEDERAIEEFLELDDTPLPPPLMHLPEGTDIQALAQRIESFADQSDKA